MQSLAVELRKQLHDLAVPLSIQERLLIVLRLLILSALLLAGVWSFFVFPLTLASLALLLVSGIAYALLFMATHEMVHGTLLGWPRAEHLLACALSWPMAFPYLTYARLHRLHHRWNGCDPRDPERTTLLPIERQTAGVWRRRFQDHLLACRLFGLGGVGLIVDTMLQGIALESVDQRLRRLRFLDGGGVLMVQALLIILALGHGAVVRYLLCWFVLERVIGVIMQFRGLVEHHGLWQCHPDPLITQLYASRSVDVPPWLNALLGGLPHHSAHHAFPWISSGRLPVASQRISRVLASHRAPALPRIRRYSAAFELLQTEVRLQTLE